MQTNFNLKRWKKCLIALCWYQLLGLFQYRLTHSSSYKLFLSKGPDISRVFFKPVQCLFCPLSRLNFWKLCSLIQKHPNLPSQNGKVVLETSAAVNQAFSWSHSLERWELQQRDFHRKYQEDISPICPAYFSSLANLACSSSPFFCTLPSRIAA